ncbi:hypothetical protein PUN71_022915 [Arthrobacter sp. NQ7]|uniref:hypothetical protein n=1 Tax=Arthrobacter sp. NQ7 TaxID=3032303 RepID=UPI00240F3B9A|nr:hypothetical protein [Arthrobacter sp. NQ7]MDJ0460065.1 hypothetical protein [Arthrobacter sp. NQ7]
MTDFWDPDGDFDYEAHHEALERAKADTAAATIGRPALAAALYHFGLQREPGPTFTPGLLSALQEWRDLIESIEAAPALQEVKALHRQAEDLERAIHSLAG